MSKIQWEYDLVERLSANSSKPWVGHGRRRFLIRRCASDAASASKRKSQALKLEQREAVHDPPQTGRDFAIRFMMDHQAAQARGEGRS